MSIMAISAGVVIVFCGLAGSAGLSWQTFRRMREPDDPNESRSSA